MKFLALVVLLAFMQASPSPRKTTETNADSNHSIQDKSAAKQTPSDPAPPVENADSSKANKQPSKTPSNPSDHVTVIVQSPVSVSRWEKAYVIFTGLLVAFGAAGIGYAIKTLRAMERQAKANEDQLIETQKASEEAGRSAIFARNAVKASERADVLMESVGIYLPTGQPGISGDARLKIQYKNYGRTRASHVRCGVELLIEGVHLANANVEVPPLILGAGQDVTISLQSFSECLTQPVFERIVRGETTLRFKAGVSYDDAFGDGHASIDIGIFETKTRTFRIEQKIG